MGVTRVKPMPFSKAVGISCGCVSSVVRECSGPGAMFEGNRRSLDFARDDKGGTERGACDFARSYIFAGAEARISLFGFRPD